MNIPRDIIKGRVYHKPKPKSYAYGCNPAAIKRAAKKYDGIDLDIRINKDGNAWCCHQSNPTRRDAWVDRKGIVNDSTPITRMTDADCARMHFQGQPMMTAERAAQLCKKSGLIPCFEAKGQDRRFYSVDWWKKFKAETTRNGVVPIVMSLPGSGGAGAKKLKAAHDAGLLTMWLWRNTAAGRAIPPFVDLVKSHTGKGGIYRKSKTPISSAPKPKPKPAPKPKPQPETHKMKLVTRAQWGARARRGSTSIGSTLGVTFHWEGPRMGTFDHSKCAAKVRGIQDFHMDGRGWSDIAYNFLVCPHGYVFEGRGVGVKSAANGWDQVNDDWYAVCYLSGQGDPFTNEAKDGFRDAVAHLRSHDAGPRVNGHRDHKATECPGDVIHAWAHSADFDSTRTTEKDELDMATEKEVRTWFREELERFVGDAVVVPPNETASYIEGAGKGQQVRLTSALTRIWRHLIDLKQR